MNTLEFDEFVRVRSGRLLRLAYALTQNHQLAEDLLQTAYTRTWPRWKRIEGDPEPYVRTVLVNTHNSWWRRRWNNERPAEILPQHAGAPPQSEVDSRDEVWRALSRLPKQQRAVLVLRYFEDLTEAQIAETLSISPGAVKSYAAKGLMKLRADETLRLPDPPAPTPGSERVTAVHERIKQRRRQRLVTIAAACAVVIAFIAGYAVKPHLRSKAFVPAEHGFPKYFDGHRMTVNLFGALADVPKLSAMWIPPDTGYKVYFNCASGGDDFVISLLFSDGKKIGSFGCSGGEFNPADYNAIDHRQPPEDRQPRQVTVLLERLLPDTKTWAPLSDSEIPDGRFAVAIGEPVPFTQYPLPQRPAELKPLDNNYLGLDVSQPGTHLLNAAHPTATFTGGLGYRIVANSQTPGLLRIRVNGKLVRECGWWDYKQVATMSSYDAPAFDAVITVEAEHTTGDWYVVIGKSPD